MYVYLEMIDRNLNIVLVELVADFWVTEQLLWSYGIVIIHILL